MNRVRCFLFSAIVVISSATFALGGDIQGPGKSEPTPTPTPPALTIASTQPTEEIQIEWPDDTLMIVQLLLAIF